MVAGREKTKTTFTFVGFAHDRLITDDVDETEKAPQNALDGGATV